MIIGLVVLLTVSGLVTAMYRLFELPDAPLNRSFRYLTVPAAVCVVCGIFWVVTESLRIDTIAARKHWPQTTATVTDARVVGDRARHPRVTYAYEVGDQAYQGVSDFQLPGFGLRSQREDAAQRTVQSVGKVINIVHHPEHPEQSYVNVHPPWSIYSRLSLGVIVYGFGLLLAITVYRFLRHDQRHGMTPS